MKVTYDLQEKEMVEYVLYILGAGDRTRFLFRLGALSLLYAGILTGIVYMEFDGLYNTISNIGFNAYTIILAFLATAIPLAYFTQRYQYMQIAKTNFNGNRQFGAKTTMQLTDASVHIQNHYAESILQWSIFEKVVETKNLLLIFVSANTAYIIPKRAFANTDEKCQFIDMATTRVNAEVTKRKLPDHLLENN